ncbi:MAG: tetratricopeptide repeat protein [Planctomycetes bacterium]|nr:tetratricopeptide repeat protein [Planctomycetota bacterium]
MSLISRRGGEGDLASSLVVVLLALGCRSGSVQPPRSESITEPAAPTETAEATKLPIIDESEVDPLEEGITRLRMGLADDALHLLEASLQRDPGNVRGLYFLGLAHAYEYRFVEARAVWENVLAIARDRALLARIETTIGLTYEVEGRTGEAIEHLQAALLLLPNYPIARDELAVLRRRGPVRCNGTNWTEAFALFLFADVQPF